MIQKSENSEYTLLTADLMVTLDSADSFILKIWIAGNPQPFKYHDEWDLVFLQEGIRAEHKNVVQYIFYDNIDMVMVVTP